VLEADIFLGRDTLKVFACHWPSKKEPESIRIKAAILLKEKLDRIPPLKDYIIAGDFNENYNECADFRTLGFGRHSWENGDQPCSGDRQIISGRLCRLRNKK